MLTGHWMLYGRPFLSLEGNGTGVMEGEAFTWAQQGNVLVITTASGMTERVGFS
ncbi:MAG: hypothetical protein JNM17_04245, partial [Archangium sp.]|nr:hypothetical protein [Archangium sp.]